VSTDIQQPDSADSQVDATANSNCNNVEVSDPSNDQIGYCYCGNGEDYDNMICCDNKERLIKRFHFSLLNCFFPLVNGGIITSAQYTPAA